MTEDQRTRVLGALRRGVSFRASCVSAGCTERELRAEMAADAVLADAVAKAQADAEVILVAQLHELAKTEPRAASWLLERVNPERYGKPKPQELSAEEVREIW